MGNATFNKQIFRTITGSLGRFVAILLIVALGVGFYAGLRTTGPDMRASADAFYDATNLFDLRVVSTMGMSDANIDALKNVEGVADVAPAYETDVVARTGGEPYVFRVHSLPSAAIDATLAADGITVQSADDAYMNRLILVEGRYPTAANECIISADRIMNREVAIGDTIEVTEGSSDLDDTLSTLTFTIVGKATSSYYSASASMGTSTLGSGIVQQFMYVPSDAFATDYPVTEAYISVAGARELVSGSVEYKNCVGKVADAIEAIAPAQIEARYVQLRDEAQAKVDDARATYLSERADAESQLADAKAQLDAAADELASGRAQLADAQAQYDAGVAELAASREDATAQMDAAAAQIDAQEALLLQSESELDSQAAALEESAASLDAQEAQVEAGAAYMSADELAAARAQIAAGRAQLQAGREQVAAAREQIAAGRAQIDAARAELVAKRAQADEQFATAQAKLDDAAAQIAQSQATIDQGQADYDSGLAEYTANYDKAQKEFADAEAKIADAQAKVNDIATPEWLVMDRTKNYGAESFYQDSLRIDSIAAVFPLIFFLVAALVALTSMTRMVDEERQLIGTFKSLGYSRARITSKYVIYALAASVVGSVVGIAALTFTLPAIIMWAYSVMYIVPACSLGLDWPICLTSAGLGVGITLVATLGAAVATLRETPAALMLPPAPKPGRRILLERITPVWRRMSFLWKVCARNIFRYKKRLFMTVVGIAGCTALLLTGFGLQDSIGDIIDKHYGELVEYNVIISVEDSISDDAQAQVDAKVKGEGGASAEARAYTEAFVAVGSIAAGSADAGASLSSGDMEGRVQQGSAAADAADLGSKTLNCSVIAVQNPATFDSIWLLRNRTSGDEIDLSAAGVVVTEKLATTFNINVGDYLCVAKQDTLGNATDEVYAVRVGAVAENYIGHDVFMTPDVYERVFGAAPVYNTIYANIAPTGDARSEFASDVREIEGVKTVAFNDETIDTYKTALKSVDTVVVVLIVAAALLAAIVLYNLTNINITERTREIATLKVLGFTRREVFTYIFREIMILAVIGAAVGLVLGVWLENFVVVTAEVDAVMFGREIHLLSFVAAFALTLVFAAAVSFAMRGKLRKIDMVESLKSIE